MEIFMKIIQSFLITFLLLISSTTIPMEFLRKSAQKYATKEVAKKAFCKSMTGVGNYILFAPLIQMWIRKVNFYQNYHTIEEDEMYTDYIRSLLKGMGHNDADSIKIIPERKFASLGIIDKKVILINKDFIDMQRNCTEQEQKENMLNQLKGVLLHEKNHLDKHHSEKSTCAETAATIGTYFFFNSLARYISPLKKFPITQALLKIPGGFSKFIFSKTVTIPYDRYHEWEADEIVTKDPAILNGIADYLTIFKNQKQAMFEEMHTIHKIPKEMLPMLITIDKWTSSHPPSEERIARLRERAKILEQQQSNQK